MVERSTHQLSVENIRELKALRPQSQVAFDFWRRLCAKLGLDSKTVITYPNYRFSALPLGHDKHWCWPHALGCKTAPEKEEEFS